MGSGLLDQQFERIESIKRQLDDQALKFIAEIQDEITRLNAYEQLYKGLDTKNNNLTPPYAESTVKKKKRTGRPYDRVTLFQKGGVYKNLFVTAKDGFFEVKSEVITSKGFNLSEHLSNVYGDIFGLTIDHEGKINKEITEELFKWILSKM